MCMRMQPCDAALPTEASAAVRGMPRPEKKPSQRAFSGLSGEPPGTTVPARSPAHASLGTYQAGSTVLSVMLYSPDGVSYPTAPTAIGYVFDGRRFLNRCR